MKRGECDLIQVTNQIQNPDEDTSRKDTDTTAELGSGREGASDPFQSQTSEGQRQGSDEQLHDRFWFLFFSNPAQIRTGRGLQLIPCVSPVEPPLHHSGVRANEAQLETITRGFISSSVVSCRFKMLLTPADASLTLSLSDPWFLHRPPAAVAH